MQSSRTLWLVWLPAASFLEVFRGAPRDLDVCWAEAGGLVLTSPPRCLHFAFHRLQEWAAESGRQGSDGKRLPLSFPEGLLIYTIFALLKKGHCQAAFK